MTLSEINIRDWKYQLIEQLFKVEDVATLKEVETALKHHYKWPKKILIQFRTDLDFVSKPITLN